MIKQGFSVLDHKTGIFHPPMFFPHVQHAVRAFIEVARDTNTDVARYPADFELFHVCSYDDELCDVRMLPQRESLGTALAILKAMENR